MRERFHIPLLIWSPLINNPGTENGVFSQLNLAMSVLGMCGVKTASADTPFFGAPLLRGNGMAYVLEDPYFGVVTDKYLYRETISGGQGYLFDAQGRPAADPQEQKRLERYARAMLQVSRDMFFSGHASAQWKHKEFTLP